MKKIPKKVMFNFHRWLEAKSGLNPATCKISQIRDGYISVEGLSYDTPSIRYTLGVDIHVRNCEFTVVHIKEHTA